MRTGPGGLDRWRNLTFSLHIDSKRAKRSIVPFFLTNLINMLTNADNAFAIIVSDVLENTSRQFWRRQIVSSIQIKHYNYNQSKWINWLISSSMDLKCSQLFFTLPFFKTELSTLFLVLHSVRLFHSALQSIFECDVSNNPPE